MPALDYLNARADWRFVIADVRGADGTPYDLTGFTAAVTFRPDADRSIDVQDATCTITAGTAGDASATPPVAATGPTITVFASAASRSWQPSRPTLIIGDVMVSKAGVPPTEDEVRRIAFVALPGTT